MQTPTWQQVGVPSGLVAHVRQLKAGILLDHLVHQMVFHSAKRLTLTYSCEGCGHNHVSPRSTDEVSQCPSCTGRRVRCIQSIKYGREQRLPPYSRSSGHLQSVSGQMYQNYQLYFRCRPDSPLDWEWHDGHYHVSFPGGEKADSEHPRAAVCRAAVLTPYLWDGLYDWKEGKQRDTLCQKFISQVFNLFTPRRE